MMKNWQRTVRLISAFISCILLGFILGSLFFPSEGTVKSREYKNWVNSNEPVAEIDNSVGNRLFLSTRIRLHGQDSEGNWLDLELYVNSKRAEGAFFEQTSLVFISYKNIYKTDWYAANTSSLNIQPASYLKQFDLISINDFSTQESYKLKIQLKDIDLTANLSDLTGDFLIKNKPEYFYYVSPGKGLVEINENTFEVSCVVTNLYSNDYSKYLFFDGKERLISETNILSLWDDKGNFYYIDITDVKNTDLPYKSHKWINYKNYIDGSMIKLYDAELSVNFRRKKPSEWSIRIPGLDDATIELKAIRYYSPYSYLSGLTIGTITDVSGSKNLTGQFMYLKREGVQ